MYCKSLVLIFSIFVALTLAAVKFTNFKCEALDPTLFNVSKCELKLKARGVVALDVYLQLLKKPVTQATIRMTIFKRANGYRPFLYNVTADFCLFMKNKKKYPVIKIVTDALMNKTNLNHTCPYNHDVIVQDLVLTDSMFVYMPLPSGDYMLQILTYVRNKAVLDVKVYAEKN